MANINTTKGLQPIYTLNGSPLNANTLLVEVPASDGTAIGLGDAVKGTGASNATTGTMQVTRCSAGDAILGVVVSVRPDQTGLASESPLYRAASTLRTMEILVGPYVVYEIASSGTLASGDVGACADLVMNTVNTTTGYTAARLDETTVTNVSAQLKIIGLGSDPRNAFGANGVAQVVIHEAELANGVAAE